MNDLLQESNKTELKSELNDKLEKEIVAFLNYREGGDFYIGVDDNGNAVSLENIDSIQLAAADRIKKEHSAGNSWIIRHSKRKISGKRYYSHYNIKRT